jgi:hypothetical protein
MYSVADFVIAYGGGVMINLVCLVLIPPGILLSYPLTGILLSRFIGRRIAWLPWAASVHNIAATKVGLILTWPVSVPRFIVALAVAKHL